MGDTRNPNRRSDDRRRSELIEAAYRVIARDGVAAATTRRIAEEAGVPGGLVHYWFADKDELFHEVAAANLGSIRSASMAAIEGGNDLLDQFREFFRIIEQVKRGHLIMTYEMTTWALRKPKSAALAEEQYTAYRQVAVKGASAWTAATKAQLPADTSVVGQFLSSLFDGLVLSWIADPDNTDVDGVLRLVDALMTQFAPEPSGTSSREKPGPTDSEGP
ncbi:TetR/AcrR family transcriptional regulator [Streptomyces sp. NPDC060000]|uniref:TetR/AcrR family transcriptional regulator n=1 Tax=Streptomyces sp. NPDC060000 TaxID=3347031 RepID=UPI0036C20B46